MSRLYQEKDVCKRWLRASDDKKKFQREALKIAKKLVTRSSNSKISNEENNAKIIQWANIYAEIENAEHRLMHNDNLKRIWIWKKCCDRDTRHRHSWPVIDYKTLV